MFAGVLSGADMKLTQLTKGELCELLKRILTSHLSASYAVNNFLLERQERKFNELMTEFEKTDIMKDFKKFERINKQLDKLHNDSNYYLRLDELKRN